MTRATRLLLLGLVLEGCITVRSATYPGKTPDQVFKGAVGGLCKLSADTKIFLVYKAEPDTRTISMVTRGFGHRKFAIEVAAAGDPSITITMQGNTPLPDMMLGAINAEVNSQKGAAAAPATPAGAAGGKTLVPQGMRVLGDDEELVIVKKKKKPAAAPEGDGAGAKTETKTDTAPETKPAAKSDPKTEATPAK